MKLLVTIGVLLNLIWLPAAAEVYRWTDSDGKVHYGDKKPAQTSENITQQVKNTNLDTSKTEQQKLEALYRTNTDTQPDLQQQAQDNAELAVDCAKVQDYLRKISGRVMFLDENGKPVHVNEATRKLSEQAAQEFAQENCPTP